VEEKDALCATSTESILGPVFDVGEVPTKYSEAMTILTLHRKLTDDEMDLFQDLVDDFFETWLELFGNDGMTNYLHLLGSGRIKRSPTFFL